MVPGARTEGAAHRSPLRVQPIRQAHDRPDTVSRWVRAYARGGLAGLEPRSRRPKRVRQPQTPVAVVQWVQALGEQYPRWGPEKLRILLARARINLSAKSIDRVIHLTWWWSIPVPWCRWFDSLTAMFP